LNIRVEAAVAITWQASMETGSPRLDAGRRALVERAGGLLAALEAGEEKARVERALRDFGDAAVRHFSHAEDCQHRGLCPALEWNGRARSELIAIVSEFRTSYEREGGTPQLADDFSCRLEGWVSRYIPGPTDGNLPCVAVAR
jgi:hemerythrin-like metal-binding protein